MTHSWQSNGRSIPEVVGSIPTEVKRIFSLPRVVRVCMNEELNSVFKYCNINKLSINFAKTTYMVISSTRLRSYIHIPSIANKTQIKYLGIYIDQKLH